MKICIEIDDHHLPHRPRLEFVKFGPVSTHASTFVLQGELPMLELVDSQQCPVSVSAVDAKGAPATVESPVWASTDATVATVTADAADPLKALIVAGLPGVAQITCTADADLGAGVKALVATLDLSVIGGEATGFVIAAGTPVSQ